MRMAVSEVGGNYNGYYGSYSRPETNKKSNTKLAIANYLEQPGDSNQKFSKNMEKVLWLAPAALFISNLAKKGTVGNSLKWAAQVASAFVVSDLIFSILDTKSFRRKSDREKLNIGGACIAGSIAGMILADKGVGKLAQNKAVKKTVNNCIDYVIKKAGTIGGKIGDCAKGIYSKTFSTATKDTLTRFANSNTTKTLLSSSKKYVTKLAEYSPEILTAGFLIALAIRGYNMVKGIKKEKAKLDAQQNCYSYS